MGGTHSSSTVNQTYNTSIVNKSDIDILIITKNIDKEIIKDGIYSILVVSSELLSQKMKQDLLPIGQMIREAKPLLNSDYLNSINVIVTRKNIKWYLDTTEDKLYLIKKVIENAKKRDIKRLNDIIPYTLVLRIRTLDIISRLIKKQRYSKKDFANLIERISNGKNAYERYLAVKNNLEYKDGNALEEIERLYEYLSNQLQEVKKLILMKCN